MILQPSHSDPGSAIDSTVIGCHLSREAKVILNVHRINKHPLEWAREHPVFFFADGKASSQALTEKLIVAVRVLGSDTASCHVVNEWSVVAAADDWFLLGQFRIPESLQFASLTPFPEAGQNSTRPEVLVAAFARDIVVLGPLGVRVAKGTVAANDALHSVFARFPAWKRAVAFRGVEA